MNVSGLLLWGFAATTVQTTLMAGARALGISRMSIPFILGTALTANRDRAAAVGFLVHLGNGWIIAAIYALVLESLGTATWWLGATIGLVHGLFVLLVLMPILPGLHPRMASEHGGPDPPRGLEPPGFLALNYGHWTAAVAIVAHIAYGIIFGGFYRLAG